MGFPFFTPKTVVSILAGAGSMAGGGGAVYVYQMPRTWKELLVKEGFVFLSTEDEYKGMFNDQKDGTAWKGENNLKEAKENDVKDKAKSYCEGKLKAKLPNSSSSDYSTTKPKLIAFCTTDGIKTVKGRLIQSKKKDWIDESNGDEKWKTVFAIYRYNDEFIKWLKENGGDSGLSKESKPSEKYETLKNACVSLLKKNHKDIKDSKYFNYGSWWCVELGYTTIEEKIKKTESEWEVKPTSDNDWQNLVTQWKDTEQVKKLAKEASSSSDDTLQESGLKALCKSDEDGKGVKTKLSEDDSYQEKYLVIKAVCKKSKSN